MAMLKSVRSVLRKAGAADYLHPVARARVAALQRSNKRLALRFPISLLIVFSFMLQGQAALGNDAKREFQCSEGNEKLTLYMSEQKQGASFGVKTPHGFVYAGFFDGIEVPLSRLVGFTGNSERDRENVLIYRGLSDTISQGKLLIFNERSNSLTILNVSNFEMSKSQCSK
jgi:hypothetical protein